MIIKLTHIQSEIKNAPNLVLIPGGPGLSSLTLRSMDLLKRSFNLIYIDFPGTNDNPYNQDHSFEELSRETVKFLSDLTGETFVLGHSFGGLFAIDLALKMKLSGIICIATPLSNNVMEAANSNYTKEKSHSFSLNKAEERWIQNPTDANFASWLSEYRKLYFVRTEGRNLLIKDKVSAKFFISNNEEFPSLVSIIAQSKDLNIKKLFIAGRQDELLPEPFLKEDALKFNFEFYSVDDASHFVTFDQTENTASIIENFIQKY